MDGNAIWDLEKVPKFVKNVWGHGRVKVVHRPYKRKDERPRIVTDLLMLHLLDVALITPLTFSLSLSFLILITHSLLLVFFILLFLLGKGVSRQFPL